MRQLRARQRTILGMDLLEDRSNPTALTSSLDSIISNRVIVSYADESHSAPSDSFVQSSTPLGFGQFAVTISSTISVTDAVTYFSGQPGIIAAGPDTVIQIQRTPNDPSFSSEWGLNNSGQSGGTVDADIDASEAWNLVTGTKATIVAVIDTGVDYNHPDLAGNIWRNTRETPGDGIDNDANGFIDDIYGYDFANNDGNPMDDEGHGTHVAGTIGAVGNNSTGVTGVNWNTRIMALKFLDANGSGATSDAIRALNYAVLMGANITNNSWGGTGPDSNLAAAINRARTAGQIFVAAAGNDGTNNNTTAFYPANYSLTYDNVISVASTDRNNNLSSFSNYGATSVTLAAPGSSILSTTPNNTYSTYSGTSMATPHVAGALSLLRDQNPTWTYSQLIAKLKSSVDLLPSLQGKVATNGRLNLFNLVNNGTTPPTPPSPPSPPPPALDITGSRVTTAIFSGSTTTSFNKVRLTFNEAIIASTFSVADIASLTGPTGLAIAPTSVSVVTGTSNTQFDINFASQTTAGTYILTVGPAINDLAGNAMDQNGNGVKGEVPGDRYTASATIGSRYTFAVSGLPVTIPDLTTVRIPLTINDNIRITDLNVSYALTHTYDSDLLISLQGPNGQTQTLVNRRGGAGDNFTNTIFDDQATAAITSANAPFTGSYKPEQTLTAFNGVASKGTWTLIVTDSARYDTGRVTAFSLSLAGSPILRLALGSMDATPGMLSTFAAKDFGKIDDPVTHGVYVGSTPAQPVLDLPQQTRSLSGRRGAVMTTELPRVSQATQSVIFLAPTISTPTFNNLFEKK